MADYMMGCCPQPEASLGRRHVSIHWHGATACQELPEPAKWKASLAQEEMLQWQYKVCHDTRLRKGKVKEQGEQFL